MSYRKRRNMIPIPSENHCKPKKPCGDTVRVSTDGVELTKDLECLKSKKGDKLTGILRKISREICKLQDKIKGEGAIGPKGPKGDPGKDGDKGDTGDIGPIGPEGPAGPSGSDGEDGADSTVEGPQGPEGPAGPQGKPGADGKDGEKGPPGEGTGSQMLLSSFTVPGETMVRNLGRDIVIGYATNFLEGGFIGVQNLEEGAFNIKEPGYYDISFNGLPDESSYPGELVETSIDINDIKNFTSFKTTKRESKEYAGFSMHTGVVKLFQGDSIKFYLETIDGSESGFGNLKVTIKKIKSHTDNDNLDHNQIM